jgi:LDH2 family malate/lactate/ureidoglycolate dehydrogenase
MTQVHLKPSSRSGLEQPPGTVRLTVEGARDLTRRALVGAGYSVEEAKIIQSQLVTNALDGYGPAGLNRALAIIMEPRAREPRRAIRIVHETPNSALLDGGNNVGYLACWRASEVALEKARATGFAVVGVNNCPFSGRNAHYVEPLARAGFVALHTTSGMPHVLPLGGRKAVMGTNPICFAFPTKGRDPIIVDMSTSAIMWGDVLLHARTGEPLPEGVGFDSDGNPTTDASKAAKGGVAPFGGHKGYALSLVVQILGLMAGAHLPRGLSSDYAGLFIVVDPKLTLPAGAFEEHLDLFIRDLKSTPRREGVNDILVPSERAFRQRRIQQEADVVDIDVALHSALEQWASGEKSAVIQPCDAD